MAVVIDTLPAVTVRMTRLVDCLCAEVDPVCYCGPFFGGDTPMDYCEGLSCDTGCGQAWVRLVRAFPSTTFPDPALTGLCSMPLAYEWEVGVARCAPSIQAGAELPSRDENLAATVQQYEDMLAMRRAIACCFGIDDVDYLLAAYTPAPVLGGCNQAVWQVFSR